MKAPEKIYIDDFGSELSFDWHKEHCYEKDIEYIRTDAFIEKALKFLDGCIPDYIDLKHANVDTFMNVDNERFIKDFINHMKGE